MSRFVIKLFHVVLFSWVTVKVLAVPTTVAPSAPTSLPTSSPFFGHNTYIYKSQSQIDGSGGASAPGICSSDPLYNALYCLASVPILGTSATAVFTSYGAGSWANFVSVGGLSTDPIYAANTTTRTLVANNWAQLLVDGTFKSMQNAAGITGVNYFTGLTSTGDADSGLSCSYFTSNFFLYSTSESSMQASGPGSSTIFGSPTSTFCSTSNNFLCMCTGPRGTHAPSIAPSKSHPSRSPNLSAPTMSPITARPSRSPSSSRPTSSPSSSLPSQSPTKLPSVSPSRNPSKSPTRRPSKSPTQKVRLLLCFRVSKHTRTLNQFARHMIIWAHIYY